MRADGGKRCLNAFFVELQKQDSKDRREYPFPILGEDIPSAARVSEGEEN